MSKASTDRPLRVIQWTTGNIGRRSLHAIIGRPDLELAGVYAHGADKVGVNRRNGLGFYTLRHVFRTVADEVRDPVAIDLIMGHTDPPMAGHYRERISDARLKAVTEHVRAWLFAEPKPAGKSEEEE